MGQEQIFSSFTGASRQGLGQKDLGYIYIPLPPVEEQLSVVKEIEGQNFQRQQVRSKIESQIYILTSYRKALIHECVTGQRRISETDLTRVKANG